MDGQAVHGRVRVDPVASNTEREDIAAPHDEHLRILIHTSDLILGGSNLNAIGLADETMRQGHEVLFAAPDGELAGALALRDIPRIRTPDPRWLGDDRFTPTIARSLSDITRRFRPHLVHSYEFPAMLHAFVGVHVRHNVPQLATNMSMTVPRNLPRSVPITVGTKALVREAETFHDAPVFLLEPPVDLGADELERSSIDEFANAHSIDQSLLTIVIVSRLARFMKLEGIQDTIMATEHLSRSRDLQLIVVGDGDARPELERLARSINDAAGRRIVIFVGVLDDPRPAYGVADIVVGMGSSAIRGMSFEKPVIVTGVDGFVQLISPDTQDHFDLHGFWGSGGDVDRPLEIARLAGALLDDPHWSRQLGTWGAELARNRFGMDPSAKRLEDLYRRTIAMSSGRRTSTLDLAALAGRRSASTFGVWYRRAERPALVAAWWASRAATKVRRGHADEIDLSLVSALPDEARRGVTGALRRLRVPCAEAVPVLEAWDRAHGADRVHTDMMRSDDTGAVLRAWLEDDARELKADVS